jgi:hypothetical protein
MVPLYVLATKIYHFPTNQLQFGQITNLELIDSESNMRDPLVNTEVAKINYTCQQNICREDIRFGRIIIRYMTTCEDYKY